MKKSKVEILEYVNPFDIGVNYDMVLASIPKGVTIENHFKNKLKKEQIDWLVNDLKHYKNNK